MMSLLKMSWAAPHTDGALLVLRVVTGVIFFMHGWLKFSMGVASVAGFLGTLGFPLTELFAVILIFVEVVGGAALVLGALTRVSALFTGFVALMSIATVHWSKGFMVGTGGYEFALLLVAACIALLVLGAGKYSIDRSIRL